MKSQKMIKANMKPEIEIRESEAQLYHVQFTRILVPPNDPKHPVEKKWTRAIRNVDFRKYFECDTETQTRFLKAMNCERAEVVHNPTLKNKEPEAIPGPETAKREELPVKVFRPVHKKKPVRKH